MVEDSALACSLRIVSFHPQHGKHFLFTVVTLLAALGLAIPAEGQGRRRGFSEEEQEDLEAGRLVVRRQARRRGELQLIGGTSFQVINRTPQEVWRAIQDTHHYDRFLPQLAEATVVEEEEDKKLLLLRHEQGPVEASYYITQQLSDDDRTVHFRVDQDRPGDLSEGWGFIQIKPYDGTKAIVTFGIFADVGSGILTGFVRPSVHSWMMRVPQLLDRYLRGSGRNRYRNAD